MKDRSRFRSIWKAIAVFVGLAIVLGATTIESIQDNFQRLKSMPIEQRRVLFDAMKRFDSLPYDERRVIRELDAQVESLGPQERGRYRSIIRRYYLWAKQLPAETRRELAAETDLQRKVDLVRKLLKAREEGEVGSRRPLSFTMVQGGPAPLEMARIVKIWLNVDPKERVDLDKIADWNELKSKLEQFDKELRVPFEHKARAEDFNFAKSRIEKAANLAKGAQKTAKSEDFLRNYLAQMSYINRIEVPEEIEPALLTRFTEALPRLVRSRFDALPVEQAKRRLKILYALVDATPEMFPAPAPPKPAKPARPAPVGGAGGAAPVGAPF